MSLLDLKGVSLSFAGSRVLEAVDFDVPAGSLVSLIGPNGAGKTSLFNCITGFYKPQQGSVRLDGTETLRMKPHQVTRLGIARTFQNVRLFREMSVLENVMSGQHCRTGSGISGSTRSRISASVGNSSGEGTSGIFAWWVKPPSSRWNDTDIMKIGWPCWIAFTRRVVKLLPSRTRSTS